MESTTCSFCNISLTPPYIQCEEFQTDECNIGTVKEGNSSLNPILSESTSKYYTPDSMNCNGQDIAAHVQPMFICLVCFSRGVAVYPHESDHQYMWVRNDFPLFTKTSWTAVEEQMLLNSIERCGLGNWKVISKMFVDKSPKDCEKHYFQFYVNNTNCKLPVMQNQASAFSAFAAVPYTFLSAPPRPRTNSLAATEMGGYMAARGDFTIEYDNLAEHAISDVEFSARDHQIDIDCKLILVESYLKKVREREKRKRVVRHFGLMDYAKTDRMYKSMQKLLSAPLIQTMKACMRLMDPEEYVKYLEALKLEAQLHHQIKKLKEYRLEGLTKLQQVDIYERLKASRADMYKKRTALNVTIANLQDKQTWHRWIHHNRIADKIASGGSLPHPTLSRKKAPPLDLTGMPGYEMLNADEKELCSVVRILPMAFFEFRNILINECKKDGFLHLAKARTLIKIDVNKTRKIYDFLITHHLINKESLG